MGINVLKIKWSGLWDQAYSCRILVSYRMDRFKKLILFDPWSHLALKCHFSDVFCLILSLLTTIVDSNAILCYDNIPTVKRGHVFSMFTRQQTSESVSERTRTRVEPKFFIFTSRNQISSEISVICLKIFCENSRNLCSKTSI